MVFTCKHSPHIILNEMRNFGVGGVDSMSNELAVSIVLYYSRWKVYIFLISM